MLESFNHLYLKFISKFIPEINDTGLHPAEESTASGAEIILGDDASRDFGTATFPTLTGLGTVSITRLRCTVSEPDRRSLHAWWTEV